MTIEIDEVVVMDDDALLPFALELDEWLTEEDDTLDGTPTITVDPSGSLAVAASPAAAYSDTQVVWWMSGGTAGTTYRITVQWTTAGGRTDERTVTVAVQAR